MKTTPLFILSTALLLSGASLQANDLPYVSVINLNPTSICGGADDDQFAQPVLSGLTTDPLGLPPPPPPAGPQAPAIAKLDQLDEASIIAILIGMLHGDEDGEPLHGNDGDDTLSDIAMWAALTGPTQPAPHGLWGDGGTDSITGEGGADKQHRLHQAVLEICGGNGNDSINGDGGDDLLPLGVASGDLSGDGLYGGNGADTLVRKLAHYIAADRFTCDPMEEDAITGDLGNDTVRPSNRIARLQQVAFSLGTRSDVGYLSSVIAHHLTGDSMDDDDLWGGGGTDEIVADDTVDF